MTYLETAARQALEALENARDSHGLMLMSDPPQDAWKYYKVDDKIRNAAEVLRSALEARTQEECVCACGDIYPADSYEAGYLHGAGRCSNCDALEARREPTDSDNRNAAINNRLYELAGLKAAPVEQSSAQKLVNEQAEDEGLWFEARTAPEAYLQQELRRLHRAVEQQEKT